MKNRNLKYILRTVVFKGSLDQNSCEKVFYRKMSKDRKAKKTIYSHKTKKVLKLYIDRDLESCESSFMYKRALKGIF